MSKSSLKVLALACATLGFAYVPANASDVEQIDVSEYNEAALPQDIYEEMGSLTPEINARGGNNGGHNNGGKDGGRNGRDGRDNGRGRKPGRYPGWNNGGRGPCKYNCYPLIAENIVSSEVVAEELNTARGGNNPGRGHNDGRGPGRGWDGRHPDRDHGRHPGRHPGRRPGWDHGGRGPDRPLPPRHFQNSCFAKNGRGLVFKAVGFASRSYLQSVAMRACQNRSARPASCRPLGCR